MRAATLKLMFIYCLISLFLPPCLYAQTEAYAAEKDSSLSKETSGPNNAPKPVDSTTASPKEKKNRSFLDISNRQARAQTARKNDEKKQLREKWRELVGADIFYPYFKAKDIEEKITEKTKVKLFKMKGRLRLTDENNQVRYTFSVKF